jgi:hypothetical protein
MKLFVGAVSATLIVAATAAQAGPLAAPGSGGSSLYQTVSDLDEPYYSDAPPVPAPVPPPAPRYGYGPGAEYSYRQAPVYAPRPEVVRPEPYRQDPYRQDAYRHDGYRGEYGYAPALLPIQEVYAIVRDHGFSPLGEPRQRGYTYVIAVLDREGEDGRLVIDARSGRIVRFVPAFQSGDEYERMRYEPGQNLPGQIAPRGGLDNLPPPTVIKVDPRLLQAMPSVPPMPHGANRTAALQPKSSDPKPVETKPAPQATASVAQSQATPPQATPPQAPVEQKPAAQILPTETMPPAQGLE